MPNGPEPVLLGHLKKSWTQSMGGYSSFRNDVLSFFRQGSLWEPNETLDTLP